VAVCNRRLPQAPVWQHKELLLLLLLLRRSTSSPCSSPAASRRTRSFQGKSLNYTVSKTSSGPTTREKCTQKCKTFWGRELRITTTSSSLAGPGPPVISRRWVSLSKCKQQSNFQPFIEKMCKLLLQTELCQFLHNMQHQNKLICKEIAMKQKGLGNTALTTVMY
jgi:hypothetical protein